MQPSFPQPYQSSQPPQNNGFGFNSFNQTQPGIICFGHAYVFSSNIAIELLFFSSVDDADFINWLSLPS